MQKKTAIIAWLIILIVILIVTGIEYPKYYKETEPWMAKDPFPWGLFVPSYVFFALAATGASLVNSTHTIFGYRDPDGQFERVIKQGTWFAIAMVIPAWIMIITDLGRPDHFMSIFLSFNIHSRIAWMGLLYTLFFLVLVVELIHLIRHEVHTESDVKTVKKMKTAELIVALIAGGFAVMVDLNLDYNLGEVFGSSTGVPAWYGAHAGIFFIVSAALIGASLEAIFLATYYWLKGELDGKLSNFIAKIFNSAIMIATATLFILVIWMAVVAYYYPPAWEMYKILLYGHRKAEFWGLQFGLGIIVTFFLAAYAYVKRNLPLTYITSIIAAIGAYTGLYLFIIGGQEARLSFHYGGLIENLNPYYVHFGPQHYSAGTPEKLLVIFAITLGIFLLSLGELLLPLEKGEKPKHLWIFK